VGLAPLSETGGKFPRVEPVEVELENAPQDGWSIFGGVHLYANPGETTVKATTGELWRTEGDLFAEDAGVRLPERDALLPWDNVQQVVRYLRPGESGLVSLENGVVLTRYGIEVRTPVSVALYPRVESLPNDALRAKAKEFLEHGQVETGWLFSAQWSDEQLASFDRYLQEANDRLAQKNALRAFAEGGSVHQFLHDPDPGPGHRIVATPGGEAKVIREEGDGWLRVWLSTFEVEMVVPANLTRP
jgi:hypothetical protein